MQSKILVVLGAAAILSVSSTAMARGAHGMAMHGSPIETSSITSASGEWQQHHCCSFPASNLPGRKRDWQRDWPS
jgi:hypothetical protein